MTETMLAKGQLPNSLCTRLIGSGALGSISTDLWGNVVHWSSEAQTMFGWSRDAAEGRSLDELLAPVLPDGERSDGPGGVAAPRGEDGAGIFEILARGPSWSGTLAKSRLDGGGPPRLVAATAFTSTKGAVIGHVLLCAITGTSNPSGSHEKDEGIDDRSLSVGDQTPSESSDALNAQDMFRQVFAESPVGTALVGTDALIIDVNSSLCRSLGFSAEELIGKNFVEFNHPDDRELELEYAQRLFDGKIDRFQIDRRFTRADRSEMTGRVTASAVRDRGGRVLFGIGVVEDVTERLRSEQAHLESETVFRRTIEATSDAFVGMDSSGRVTDWNAAAERLFGWSSHETFGMPLVKMIVPDEYVDLYNETLLQALASGATTHATEAPSERFFKDRAGREFSAEVSLVVIEQDGRFFAKAFIRDVSQRHALEDQLTKQALTDSLTGLPNRALLRDRLDTAVARLDRNPGLAAVMMLDMDRFKVVNDSLGHDAGDEMLTVVADRIRCAVRAGDTVGRVGGDEFVVVAEDFDDTSDVVFLADRVIEAVSAPLQLHGLELHPSASIGIAVATNSSATADKLLRDADLSMYRAKERGGGSAELFDDDLYTKALARLELEGELRRAIDEEQLARVLPTCGVVRRPSIGFRGSGAMGAPRTRSCQPGGFHTARRGDGPRHTSRLVGARTRSGTGRALAGDDQSRVELVGESFEPPAERSRVAGHRSPCPGRVGAPCELALPGADRDRAHRGPGQRRALSHRAEKSRYSHRCRRLRDGVLVVDLRSQVPRPGPEAGQTLRRGAGGERGGRDDRRLGDPSRPRARTGSHRRRCRDAGPVACARFARLRPGAGFLLVEASSCRRDRAGSAGRKESRTSGRLGARRPVGVGVGFGWCETGDLSRGHCRSQLPCESGFLTFLGLPESRATASGKHEVDVAELVPQVTLFESGLVRAIEQIRSGDRLQHRKVRSLGLVPSGQQPVDRTDTTVRRHDCLSPTASCVQPAAFVHDRLEGAHNGGADGDDPSAVSVSVVDSVRSRA